MKTNDLAFTEDEFQVIHPLFDVPEKKLDGAHLGLMKLSKTARFSLIVLRLYLIAMLLLTIYRCLQLAEVIA